MRRLLLLLLFLVPSARAEEGSFPATDTATRFVPAASDGMPPPPEARPAPSASLPRLGVALDLGAPEGAALGLLFRPVPAFRLWGGPAWNYVGWGFQGGLALVPFQWAIAPTLSLEAGRYFDADVTRFVNEGSGAPAEVMPLLRRVGFTYAAVLAGIEIGSQRGFAFSLRAGVSRIGVVARGSSQSTGAGGTDVSVENPRLTAVIPSVKLGVQLFF
jgi:hypothetical protein